MVIRCYRNPKTYGATDSRSRRRIPKAKAHIFYTLFKQLTTKLGTGRKAQKACALSCRVLDDLKNRDDISARCARRIYETHQRYCK